MNRMADQLRGGTSNATASLVDLGVQTLKLINSVRARQAGPLGSAFGRLGFKRRGSAAAPFMFFTAGAIVAGGVALLVTPTSGKVLRGQIRGLWSDAKHKGLGLVRPSRARVESAPSPATSANGIDPAVSTNR